MTNNDMTAEEAAMYINDHLLGCFEHRAQHYIYVRAATDIIQQAIDTATREAVKRATDPMISFHNGQVEELQARIEELEGWREKWRCLLAIYKELQTQNKAMREALEFYAAPKDKYGDFYYGNTAREALAAVDNLKGESDDT